MAERKKRLRRSTTTALALLAAAAGARAQDQGGGGGSEPTVTTESAGGTTTINVTPPSVTTQTTTAPAPGYPAPGTDLEEHLPSSSKATMDTSRSNDGFDLNQSSGGATTLRGGKNSQAILGEGGGGIPGIHTVRRGDTLWDISGRYYKNPWNWPKVWSYNPHIQNPHWIYPGDQIRLRRGGADVPWQQTASGFIDRRPIVPRKTVFLRSQGYIDKPDDEVWGEVVGAREDQMLLAYGNNVYMVMRPGVQLKIGQNLAIFRPVRPPKQVKGARNPKGQIIRFYGTVRIDAWDPDDRVAKGRIVEALDVIERGAKVGPVARRFDVVPPRTNRVDLKARVLTSTYPHLFFGQNQVLFIDRGSDDGLRPGNRLFIVRKGDSWRRTLKNASDTARSRLRTDLHEEAQVERTPLKGDERKFPEEVVGELRILRTREQTSIAIVTASSREIQPGDRAVAKKGY